MAAVAEASGGRRRKRRGPGGEGQRPAPAPAPKRRKAGGVSFGPQHLAETSCYVEGGLRKVRPYFFDFQTYCKGRWVGRSLLHVFRTEFRAHGARYYRAAARAGRLRLNGEAVTDLQVTLKDNDFLQNRVHRHEPPVTAEPIRVLAEDEEVVVVDKPSSMPVHPCGRFRHNTVIFILGQEHQLTELHPLHRLDRLTSGVLMFAKTAAVSERIHEQVRERQLEKEYVCRVEGEFPEGELTCQEPILVVSYKVGVCRVDPRGKPCRTVFRRLSCNGRSSVVLCRPLTGRTHQIRVHLQYLGHPILNDPIYNAAAWGPARGRGGRVAKTDEELLRDLLAEHRARQSLTGLGPGDDGDGDDDDDLGPAAPSAEREGHRPPPPGPDAERGDVDPLCEECRLARPDPSPQELVMYLHASCYKGPGFEYSSPLPAWAQDDWQEDSGPPRSGSASPRDPSPPAGPAGDGGEELGPDAP
ncbi:RNA pseudouridylate synthase domain-containing protein 2 [Tachyglossus aculeatus]|uniref:RNA pseudouridylate synthase domain-containing protein 2 n=1 Tax=Tachyglossus aculeatus TaxID=9261 RepID=UPI0018F3AA2D|nr:RNA pseudouridylate synthase domain-containing protein 2 [Tachyglossus aculeatus]